MTEEEKTLWDVYLEVVKSGHIENIAARGKKTRYKKADKKQKDQNSEPDTDLWMQDDILKCIIEGKAETNRELLEEFQELRPILSWMVSAHEKKTLKQIRLLARQQQMYKLALDELSRINVFSYLKDHLDEYVRKDAAELEEYLCQEELIVFTSNASGHFGPGSILKPSNSDSFFAQFEEDALQTFLENMFFHRKLSRHLVFRFAHSFHYISQVLETTIPDQPRIITYVLPAAESICEEYMQKMHQIFNMRHVLELVSTRKRYRKSAAHYEKNMAIRSALLRAIPSHYRDLYPLARMMHRSFILHIGPTNSGKTYDAVTRLEQSKNGVYLAPLRLLAYEQFDTINHDGIPCSLLTGEEEISVVGSHITASTIEMVDLKKQYDIAVIDEAQMIVDPERGGSWSSAILGLCAEEIHVCASLDAEELLARIIRDCGDSIEIVHHYRQTELIVQKHPFQFPKDVQDGDALVVFSKRSVHAVAAELQYAKRGTRTSIIYGALPYEVRHEQARRFREGETQVVVSTDAIGMGLNLPIHRIVFLEMTKFDGHESRDLYSSEIKQIAGRAGRFGIYNEGLVAATGGISILKEALFTEDQPLQEAVIQFHESLLGIDAPLSVILSRWNDIEPQKGWNKANIERLLFLANTMEHEHTDKYFLYRMITIPFDEQDSTLFDLWKEMYYAEERGKHLPVLERLPAAVDPKTVTERELDSMEQQYRICDLFANYIRLFMHKRDDLRSIIEERKALLSKAIMKVLAGKKLRGKVCRRCGRVIPWNYPFSMCEKCFQKERH